MSARSRLHAACAALGLGIAVLAACSEGEVDGVLEEPTTSTPIPDSGAAPDAATPTVDSGTVVVGPVCGNGKREEGEACDDGNKAASDGCSPTCALESAFEGDTCPGKTLTLAPDGTLLRGSATGTTVGAYNQYSSGCGGGSGKDVVYTLSSPTSGKAKVTLDADFAGIVSARSDCSEASSEVGCGDIAAATGGSKTIELPVFANTPVFLVVDGYGGATGTFTLSVEVSTAKCGNGVAELPEACDDGNLVNGDGCSSTCTLEAGGVISQCPGQPFELSGAPAAVRSISFAGNTATSGAQTQGSIGCFYWSGSNTVYAVKSDVNGAVKAELHSGYTKANLHARSECGANTYQLGCSQVEAPGTQALEFPVKAGQWFYLFVDGHKTSTKDYAGPYSLDVKVTPSACGNGALDGNETCDDGNLDDGDGCSATCTLEAQTGTNACPGRAVALAAKPDGTRAGVVSGTTVGNANTVASCNTAAGTSSDAIYAITPDIDGLLEARVRGPFNTILSVLSSCAAPVGAPASVMACSWKGNATSDPMGIDGLGSMPKRVTAPVVAGTTYYVVVDSAVSSGNAGAGTFTVDLKVTPSVCGNGVLEGGEQCDDGATDADDGCSATCQLEAVTSRSTCANAEAITLTAAGDTFVAALARGTTNLLANGDLATSTSAACSAPGRNAMFSVIAPVAGVLRASVKSTQFDAVLGFRKPTCALTGVPFMCANDTPLGGTESLATPVTAGETVWIAVDGKVATEYGRFTLDVSVSPSGCGDGFFVPGPGEECDDGNVANGDGCSSTCTLEPKAGVDTCPGVTLTLAGQETKKGTMTFSTAALNADYAGLCGGNAKDGVVRVVAPIAGTLKAVAKGMAGATVYARRVCTDPSSEIAKSPYSTCPSVVHDTVTFAVAANEEVFLFVDGLDGATGVPTLEVTVAP